jgi:hypothetical protein
LSISGRLSPPYSLYFAILIYFSVRLLFKKGVKIKKALMSVRSSELYKISSLLFTDRVQS